MKNKNDKNEKPSNSSEYLVETKDGGLCLSYISGISEKEHKEIAVSIETGVVAEMCRRCCKKHLQVIVSTDVVPDKKKGLRPVVKFCLELHPSNNSLHDILTGFDALFEIAQCIRMYVATLYKVKNIMDDIDYLGIISVNYEKR